MDIVFAHDSDSAGDIRSSEGPRRGSSTHFLGTFSTRSWTQQPCKGFLASEPLICICMKDNSWYDTHWIVFTDSGGEIADFQKSPVRSWTLPCYAWFTRHGQDFSCICRKSVRNSRESQRYWFLFMFSIFSSRCSGSFAPSPSFGSSFTLPVASARTQRFFHSGTCSRILLSMWDVCTQGDWFHFSELAVKQNIVHDSHYFWLERIATLR